MRGRMIEDALEFYEIEYKTSKPVEDIQVNIPTTTTFIINCAQLLLTEATKGSTRDILITGYIEIEKLHNFEYLQCMTNPVLWEKHQDELEK
jgi:hypothetical protein